MSSIDERVVKMEFDNKQFESGVSATLTSLDKLKQSLQFKDGAFDGVQKSVQSMGDAFGDLQSGANSISFAPLTDGVYQVQQQFSFLGEFVRNLYDRIANWTIDLGRNVASAVTIDPIRDGFAEYDLQMTSTQTIMASTGKSIDEVTAYLDELNTYADKTIYSFSDMTSNIGKFTNAGVDLDVAVAAIQGISNEAAVSGANAQEASRAMYNFAQALSAGYVKLIDWKSIENANMATKEFKEQLLETAVEMGTVEKTADGMYRVLSENGQGKKMSDLIDATHNFNDSLAYQWMTTDVLTATLGKYADETTEIGRKAFAAATEVKTFNQLIDTLKEALGSGWTKSFTYMIGNLEEAKELWTGVNDELSAIIDAASDARNAVLEIWHDAEETGSGGRLDALRAIADVYYGIKSAITSVKEAFEATFGSPTIEESAAKLMELTRGFSRFAGSFREFLESDAFVSRLQGILGGAFSIAQAVMDVMGRLAERLSPLADGISQFAWYVFSAADSLGRLISYFIEADDKVAFLKDLFAGTSGVSQRLSRLFMELGLALDAVVSSILKVLGIDVDGTPVTDLINTIQSFLREHVDLSVFDNLLDKIPSVSEVFENLKSALSGVADLFGSVASKVGELLKAPLARLSSLLGGSAFSDALDGTGEGAGPLYYFQNALSLLGDGLDWFFGLVSNIGPKIGEALHKMVDFLGSEKFGTLAENFRTIMGGVLLGSGGGLLSSLTDLVGAFREDKFGEKEGFSLEGFIDSLKSALGLDSLVSGFTGAIDSLTETLSNFQNSLNASSLLKIGVAIALLAGSLVAISNLDADGMANGIAGLSVLFGELMGAFSVMTSMKSTVDSVKMSQAASAMVKMGIAVGIMAVALKYLSDLDVEQMKVGLIGIVTMLGAITFAGMMLSVAQNDISKTATGILVISVAMRILVTSVKYLADLDWDQLTHGLVGVGILLLEVALFARTVDDVSSSLSSVFAILAVTAAVKLLAGTVKDLSGMSWGELARGLVAVGGLMLEVGVFMRLANKTSMSITALASILVVVAAVRLLSDVVQVFAGMGTSSLEQGVLAIGVLILELSAITAVLGKSRITLRDVAAVYVVAVAVRMLADVLKELGGLDPDSMDRGLVGLGFSVAALAIPLAIVGRNASGMLVGAAAMLVMAAAIRVIVPAISALGEMPTMEIIKAFVTLVAVLGTIGASSILLEALAPSIFVASAAIAAFGVACGIVGASILLVSAGITALGASLAVSAVSIVAGLGVLATGIQSLIVAVIVGFFEGIAQGAVALLNGVADILAALEVAIHAIGDFLIANIPYVCAVIGTVGLYCIAAIGMLVPAFLAVVGTFIAALLSALATWMPPITDALLTALVSLFNSLADGIRTHGPEILSAVGNLLSSIVELVLLAVEDIVRMIPGVGDMLGDAVADIRTSMNDGLSSGAGEMAVSGFMSGVGAAISTGGDGVAESATGVAAEAKDAMREGLGDGGELSGEFMTELADEFTSGDFDLSSLTDGLTDSLTMDLSPAANESLESFIGPLDIDASELPIAGTPEDLLDILGSYGAEFGSTGDTLANTLADSIGSPAAQSTAQSNGAAVANSGVSGADSVRPQYNNTGYYGGVGFGNGLSSASGYVNSKAAALANGALSTMNTILQVASPSRATMRTGRFTGEGLAIGMGQMVPYVEKQASKLGGGALDGLRDSMSRVGELLSSDIDFDPTIRPVLDLSEIQNGVSAMGGMLDGRLYGVSMGIGSYALDNMIDGIGKYGAEAPVVKYEINIDGARINDVPAIQDATYDFLMTLRRYGDM